MTTSALLTDLLVALARAVPELIDALRPDVAADVRAALAGARARLPAPGSIRDAVEAVIDRHEERDALTIAAATGIPHASVVRVLRAAAQFRQMPPVLDTPRGAWSEPGEGD